MEHRVAPVRSLVASLVAPRRSSETAAHAIDVPYRSLHAKPRYLPATPVTTTFKAHGRHRRPCGEMSAAAHRETRRWRVGQRCRDGRRFDDRAWVLDVQSGPLMRVRLRLARRDQTKSTLLSSPPLISAEALWIRVLPHPGDARACAGAPRSAPCCTRCSERSGRARVGHWF